MVGPESDGALQLGQGAGRLFQTFDPAETAAVGTYQLAPPCQEPAALGFRYTQGKPDRTL